MTSVHIRSTATEEAAEIAWEQFAAEQKQFARLFQTVGVDPIALRDQLVASIEAERRWKELYALGRGPASAVGIPAFDFRGSIGPAIVAPAAAESAEAVSAWLVSDGILLFTLIIAVLAFVFPYLPLVATILALPIGAWISSFARRLAVFLGRIL